ncbi:MAG: hypothetical protein ACLRFE_00350 [Clostridia bacterium]
MTNFNVSHSRFLKTVNNPSKYYLDMIRKYVGKISDPEMLEDDVKFFVDRLKTLLEGDKVDDPKILHKIAYFTFDRVLYEACEDTYKTPNRALALERDIIIDNKRNFRTGNTFYSRARDYFRSSLYSFSTVLTSKNSDGTYTVVDFDAVSNHLHNALDNYYRDVEKKYPNLLTSSYPTKSLHNTVKNSLQEIDDEFRKIIYNLNTESNSRTF